MSCELFLLPVSCGRFCMGLYSNKAYSWNYFSYVYLDMAFWEIYILIMRTVLEFWVVWILNRRIQDLVKIIS